MHIKPLAAALFALATCAAALGRGTPSIEDAHTAYYREQYSQALALYQQLAERGNAEAAERAGFMLFEGSVVYGRQVRRDFPRARTLLVQAAKAGRPGAGFVLNMIERAD